MVTPASSGNSTPQPNISTENVNEFPKFDKMILDAYVNQDDFTTKLTEKHVLKLVKDRTETPVIFRMCTVFKGWADKIQSFGVSVEINYKNISARDCSLYVHGKQPQKFSPEIVNEYRQKNFDFTIINEKQRIIFAKKEPFSSTSKINDKFEDSFFDNYKIVYLDEEDWENLLAHLELSSNEPEVIEENNETKESHSLDKEHRPVLAPVTERGTNTDNNKSKVVEKIISIQGILDLTKQEKILEKRRNEEFTKRKIEWKEFMVKEQIKKIDFNKNISDQSKLQRDIKHWDIENIP